MKAYNFKTWVTSDAGEKKNYLEPQAAGRPARKPFCVEFQLQS